MKLEHGKRRTILINGGSSVNTNVSPFLTGTYPAPSRTTAATVQGANNQPTAAVPAPQSQSQTSAKVNSAGPITTGITKNVNTDSVEHSAIFKWFRAIFTGIPFTIDNYVTTFQVFPDYSGQTLNSAGYACDQAIIYGKVPVGLISENNDVEVYGERDTNGNIIAGTIKNTASGTTVTAHWSLSANAVKTITTVVFALLAGGIYLFAAGTGGFRELAMWLLGIVVAILIIVALIKKPRLIIAIVGVAVGIALDIFKGIFRFFLRKK
jgi:hypothetical protein